MCTTEAFALGILRATSLRENGQFHAMGSAQVHTFSAAHEHVFSISHPVLSFAETAVHVVECIGGEGEKPLSSAGDPSMMMKVQDIQCNCFKCRKSSSSTRGQAVARWCLALGPSLDWDSFFLAGFLLQAGEVA